MLEKINGIKDLEKIETKEEKQELAKDIRNKIISVVSNNGGHLASNLGVVELTIAMHKVFDFQKDKVVWDVGHQSYVHKILTGRKDQFETLRQLDGIAGFPKTKESNTDCFNSGHSSDSISVALGMARAQEIKMKNRNLDKVNVMAVIGDGALTGGMALEALNDAGASRTKLLVILNDNEMSISKNIGGLNMFLSKLRTKKTYASTNKKAKNVLNKIPFLGIKSIKVIQRLKRGLKQMIIPKMYFEDIGFKYLGPVDGHDIEKLECILKTSKQLEGPVLIHVLTKKGKGYIEAEKHPDKFHATSPFDVETGKIKSVKKKDYSQAFGEKLVSLASKNKEIVAISASMIEGTGLKEFSKLYPDRLFDVGIAEQHAVGLAAGLAKGGLIPVVPIYSSFYQRAYDQVIHDIAIQGLAVVMCVDRAGVVGNDGETHQGIFDFAFFRLIPNIEIMAPKDFEELSQMLEYAVNRKKAVVIRYPRGGEEMTFDVCKTIECGKAELLKEGQDVSILAIGKEVSKAVKIAEELQEKGINAEVINIRFLKPLDRKTIIESIEKTNNVVVLEDGTNINGLGTAVKELIVEENMQVESLEMYSYPDKFIEHGTVQELEKRYGIDKDSIIEKIEERCKNEQGRIITRV